MGYIDDLPYLYGKLNKEVKLNTYTGESTDTAAVVINNSSNIITTDVNPTIILGSVKIDTSSNEMVFSSRADTEISRVQLSGFQQEQSNLAETDSTSETFVKNKSTRYLSNEGSSGNYIYAEIAENALQGGHFLKWDDVNKIISDGGTLNIENGTGLDTLVLKYSGEVDDLHYASSTTGESDVCLGEANISSGKRNIIAGKLNKNTSSNTLIVGLRNTVSGNHSIIGGTDNSVTGHAGVIAGTDNTVEGYNCLGSGTSNIISGFESIFNGYKNTQTGYESFILGDQNRSEFNQTFISGVKNIASRERQYIFGSYAKENSNAVFIVSDRKGPSDAKLTDNNFMVMSDGRAKVYGEPVESDDAVRKLELDNSWNEFNLENGIGLYSIKQKEDETVSPSRANETNGRANAAFGHKNKTYQRDAFAFGGGNKVGLTYEEWLVLNPGGTQEQYEASYSFSAGFGENNTNTGKDSFVFGGSNTNGSDQVLESGYGNTVDGNSEKSQVFGEVNTLQNSPNSMVFGKNNILVNAKNCTAFGYGHKVGSEGVTSAQDSFLAGYNLVNYYSNKIVLGHHNINLSGTLLELGNGNTSTNSNAFEVYQDGRAKVYGAPVDDNDVVRKGELDKIAVKIPTQEQMAILF